MKPDILRPFRNAPKQSTLSIVSVLTALTMLSSSPLHAQSAVPVQQARASEVPTLLQGSGKANQEPNAAAGKPEKRVKRTSGFYEPLPFDFNDHSGYTQIFDGVSLKGWDGDPDTWHVEDGAIVGDSTVEKPLANSYIAYRDMEAKDFDLKLEIRVEHGGGSGIQYRSHTGIPWRRPFPPGQPIPDLKWMMTGPQADFWFPVAPMTAEWTGQFYSENTPLGIIAWRGQFVESSAGNPPQLMGDLGDREALGGYVKVNDWNQYQIIARGGTFIHVINGHVMAVYIDDDPNSSNNKSGFIGIEIEGTPSKVSVRNVWIKKLN